ncbi:hypothetical protein BaRGS_00003633 [Batillaria attramentaria]|uniref:C1q domain-containing protein n=1 Tax=Batillaria attramentaria TaxID=370345 RepID=A0ABD0M0Z0_9CAEN
MLLLSALSVTPVAFTAAVSTPGTVRATSGKVVPFHTVILNTGTVYNSSSSLFTAPRDGDYFFILNVDVSKDHDCISIRRNGGTVIVADRDDTVSTHLTGSGVMGLKRGDTVGAYHCTSAGYVESGLESTFSGFLIR